MSSMAQGANGVVGWLLRSSFSGLLERSLLLLDVHGRRTGRHYRLPVQYAQAGPVIWVLPAGHERKTWWRNLLQEQPVQLWLGGQQLSGRAWAVSGATDLALALDGLRVYLRRFPSMTRRSGITRPDGTIDENRLRELAARTVIVRILPDEDAGTAGRPAPHPEDGELERDRGVVAAVRRHPLGAFYLLTFALSWAYWVSDALAGGHRSHFPGLLGPAIAAIVITGLTRGRAGLRDLGSRMLRWRVPARWYLAAAAPLLVAVAAAAILQLTGAGFPGWAAFGRMPGLPDLGVAAVVAGTLLINGFGEETGWAWLGAAERSPLARQAPGQCPGRDPLDAVAPADLLPGFRLPGHPEPTGPARVRPRYLRGLDRAHLALPGAPTAPSRHHPQTAADQQTRGGIALGADRLRLSSHPPP